jgi:SAM-dependent methyltransferase
MSLSSILIEKVPDISNKHVYELSSRGPLFNFLKKNAGKLTSSEYSSSAKPGSQIKDGVFCQDVQRLTFEDCKFDICTSTEVFEHVPDDISGFSEINRVLKPGGYHIFSVPIDIESETQERATLKDGSIIYLLPPEYHKDPFHGEDILAFRNYGHDITQRVRQCGFIECEIITPRQPMPWGYSRHIVVARKPFC